MAHPPSRRSFYHGRTAPSWRDHRSAAAFGKTSGEGRGRDVDGSARPQTVYKETNARCWSLIDAFREISGVPMVLNTSFNENEPVVCRPNEPLDCFLRTQMDVLVLGDHFIERRTSTQGASSDRG